jgi:heptosyltransferase-2
VSKEPKKILIRGVNWIGDAVLTLPALKAIRRFNHDSHISLLVKPWVAELFTNNMDIDEIILYDDEFKGLAGKFKLARILRRKNFDRAILLQNAFDAAFITWLSGIPERLGYKTDGRGLFLTRAINIDRAVLQKHQVSYYLNILNSVGIETPDFHPYIHLTAEERNKATDVIKSGFPGNHYPIIGINPGAVYGPAKRWPSEKFAELIKTIIDKLDGKCIIFGSKAETGIADEINSEITKLGITNADSRILALAGKTGLRELAALIAECDVFVTNDSGPMHMASALYMPVVAIFGSTNPVTTGPFGERHKIITKAMPCSPCMERECPEGHVRCMTEVRADEVFEAVENILPVNKAVFLDKDGTIIADKNYLNSFEELEVLPGTKDSLRRLKNAGFLLIGITNQSGIGRGIVEEKFVIESNAYLQDKLEIDDFYYCPHHPDDHCPCRKPEPMLVLQAGLKHRINLKVSFVIGDKESDVLLAQKTGGTGILLSSTPLVESTCASYVAKDLKDSVDWILEKAGA